MNFILKRQSDWFYFTINLIKNRKQYYECFLISLISKFNKKNSKLVAV